MNFARSVWKHLTNWPEGYLWIPLAFFSILLSALFVRLLTGRAPQESMTWLVDANGKFVVCVYVIVLCSIMRQATGIWLTKEERLSNQWFSVAQGLFTCFFAALWAWVFLH